MQLKSNLIEALLSLMGAKQRSILALIGIVVGIGSVIAMVSIGTIVQNEALRQFKEMGTDIMTISKGFGTGGGRGQRQGTITVANALELPQFCPAVKSVAPYASIYGNLKYAGKRFDAPLLGVTQGFLAINKLRLKQGRFIHDLDQQMLFCVVGRKVAQKLRSLGVAELIGTQIFFKQKLLTILGEIAAAPMGGMRPYQINDGIMIPIAALQRIERSSKIESIMARKTPGADHKAATEQIQAYFKQNIRGIRMEVRSAEELIQQMQKQMRLFTLLLGAIGSISLIVGGVGVMNVMLVSVSERKKEIGIRRALGARQGDIQGQFLMEAVTLCLVGGLLGAALGVGASRVIAHFAKWQFMVAYSAMLIGILVAAVVGIFFGFYPARQAAKLNPINALRTE